MESFLAGMFIDTEGCACDAMVQNKGLIIPVNDPNPDEPRLPGHA